MERRTFMAMVSGSLFVAPPAAEGQQAGKVYSVNILMKKRSEPAEARRGIGLRGKPAI